MQFYVKRVFTGISSPGFAGFLLFGPSHLLTINRNPGHVGTTGSTLTFRYWINAGLLRKFTVLTLFSSKIPGFATPSILTGLGPDSEMMSQKALGQGCQKPGIFTKKVLIKTSICRCPRH